MSRMSSPSRSDAADPSLSLLAQASTARMPDSELRLWEAALDPVRLDLCGCRRGAAAAALAAPAGAALVLTGTCPLPWAAGLWAGVVLAVKLATQAGAMRERGRMHARLEVRIEQLDRRQQPA